MLSWSVFRRLLATPSARELLLGSLAAGEADSARDLDRARANRAVSHAFVERLLARLGVPRAIRWLAGLAIDASFLARWLFPGGLDAAPVAEPMRAPRGRG